MRWTIALSWAALLAPMAAAAQGRECPRSPPLGKPELWRVTSALPVRFIAGERAGPDCPGPGPACRLSEQAAPGALLAVTGRAGPFACAAFVGPAPALVEAHGWLPLAVLARVVGQGRRVRWAGDWRTGAAQSLTIRAGGKGRLSVHGLATWGAQDPARVAEGRVNTGELDARGAPRGDRLDLAAAGGCAARLWRLGPYLVAADNGRCGGANVSFTGVYRRARSTAPD